MGYEGDGVGAAEDVLATGFQFEGKTVASTSVVAEESADIRIVEIAPKAEITVTATKF